VPANRMGPAALATPAFMLVAGAVYRCWDIVLQPFKLGPYGLPWDRMPGFARLVAGGEHCNTCTSAAVDALGSGDGLCRLAFDKGRTPRIATTPDRLTGQCR